MINPKIVFPTSISLKRKLMIAFCLMFILPLLVSMYLVSNYVLPMVGFRLNIALIASILISLIIVILGFFLIKEVFDCIVSVSSEAKLIVGGDINRRIEVDREDEVGYLGEALNQLTLRIRGSMEELKGYSEKTTQINIEIQKRVLVLSSLLQISSLISQQLKLDDILKFTIEKARVLANSDVSLLFLQDAEKGYFYLKAADGLDTEYLSKTRIETDEKVFKGLIKTNKPLVIDKENRLAEDLKIPFYEKFRLNNFFALPVFLQGQVRGIIGIGSNIDPFSYKKDDLELLDIFAKQISIAVENDLLLRSVEKLQVKDALTGLYNEAFIRERLQEEIKRAITYQRPCSFILLSIDSFQKYQQKFGLLEAESVLKKIGDLIKYSITEIDRASRTGDDEFAVVLPERNKRQAQDVAEDLKRKIEFVFSEEQDINKKITISSGVSENPVDGMTAEELFAKARELPASV